MLDGQQLKKAMLDANIAEYRFDIRTMTKIPKAPSPLEEAFVLMWRAFGNGMEYVREYEFAESIERKWKFDFAWPDLRVAVAIDGGKYAYRGGRHATDEDKEKCNQGVIMGWYILHFSSTMLNDPMEVCRIVKRLLSERLLSTYE